MRRPTPDENTTPDIRATVARAHQAVMDAIEAGDADAAGRRLARHGGAYVHRVKLVGPSGLT